MNDKKKFGLLAATLGASISGWICLQQALHGNAMSIAASSVGFLLWAVMALLAYRNTIAKK
jgi:hypothetical protein